MEYDISKLSKATSGFIGLDVANGYTIKFVDAVKKLRDKCPHATIAAGNVCADMTQELILAGADIVKIRLSLHNKNQNWYWLSSIKCCY